MKVALLPKKTRGAMVVGEIVLRYGNEKSLVGKEYPAAILGHLLMRGTKKYTFEQIQDELDVSGGELERQRRPGIAGVFPGVQARQTACLAATAS